MEFSAGRPQRTEKIRKRSPVIAFIFSFLVPGLGQVYNGRLARGAILFLLATAGDVLFLCVGTVNFHAFISLILFNFCLFLFVIVDAVLGARRVKMIALRRYNRGVVYLAVVVLSFLASFVFDPYEPQTFPFMSSSMEPTLVDGDYFVADPRAYRSVSPERGDLVVCLVDCNTDHCIILFGRVIGLGGEKIRIEDTKVFINGQLLDEPWPLRFDPKKDWFRPDVGPVTVPEGSFYVMADNRDHSQDSRKYGPVPADRILAKPLYIYWAKDKARIGTELR